MAYCVFRFRHRKGIRAAYEPENKKLEWWLTIGTGVGVAAMLAPGLFVWHQFVTVPADATEVEVVGQQWQWSFRLPGKDGRLGTSDVRNISSDNPLGLNPNDPNGKDDVVIVERRLALAGREAGQGVAPLHRRPARFLCARVPGQDGHGPRHGHLLLVDARPEPERSMFSAAELCGIGHPQMRGKVVVDTESDYQAWLEQAKDVRAIVGVKAIKVRAMYGSGDKSRMLHNEDSNCIEAAPHDEKDQEVILMVDVQLWRRSQAIPPAEVGEVELYHPKSWWTQYVFRQDAKVIAIQYSLTATRRSDWWLWCCRG